MGTAQPDPSSGVSGATTAHGRMVQLVGWIGFTISLPLNLLFLTSWLDTCAWIGAALVCAAGSGYYAGIGRWWLRDLDRSVERPRFRGYILGAACLLGTFSTALALALTPDADRRWVGFALLFILGASFILWIARRWLRARVRI